jgi:hypothetical protein
VPEKLPLKHLLNWLVLQSIGRRDSVQQFLSFSYVLIDPEPRGLVNEEERQEIIEEAGHENIEKPLQPSQFIGDHFHGHQFACSESEHAKTPNDRIMFGLDIFEHDHHDVE